MTNSKLTNERLTQIDSECEERKPTIDEIRAMVAELQRRRKADEQKPVAWMHTTYVGGRQLTFERIGGWGSRSTPLYTAQRMHLEDDKT